MSRAATLVSAVVLAHLAVSIVHGAAHAQLQIALDRRDLVFVLGVIGAAPLLAMALQWSRYRRAGLMVLTVSMIGSLAFGVHHHFMAAGPDLVGHQPAGPWASAFGLTSYLLAITEAAGVAIGLYYSRSVRSGDL